jgi:hypothetical protein
LADKTTIRHTDSVFQSKSLSTPIWLEGKVARCDRSKRLIQIIQKGIMDTQQNPNEPGKSPSPGQQGGQEQDREREERERQRREREKQGGGQQGGGQQGAR